MKAFFLGLFFAATLFSCKKETPKMTDSWTRISERVQYQEDNSGLHIRSGKFSYHFKKEQLPLKKSILLNSSLMGYFTELNLEDKIQGLSSPEYIFSDKILNLIKSGKIQNVGNEQKYDLEKIIALKPDAVFTNYVPNFENTYDLLKKNGIPVIFLDEYLEQNPLEKSKYLLLFGELFGVEDAANARYKSIESTYQLYKEQASKSVGKPVVICNEMYGNQWFLPGGKTSTSILIKDANAQYILGDNSDSGAKALSFEEVFVKAKAAQFWINLSSHQSKQELLNINPNYTKLNVFNNGKLYMVNNREKGMSNDYFQSGVVRADMVLKDYIKMFHPEVFPNEALYYMKELK